MKEGILAGMEKKRNENEIVVIVLKGKLEGPYNIIILYRSCSLKLEYTQNTFSMT